MIYAAGIDVGSTQTKGIIIDQDQRIIARALGMTGANVTRAGANCFNEALKLANVKREDVRYVIGTGYGRYKVTFGDAQITEISCHARGAFYLFPNTKTVIDMGGQDAKGIKIGEDGLPKPGQDGNPVVERFAFGADTDTPVDLVFGRDGAMYVADIFNSSIFRITRNREHDQERESDGEHEEK